MMLSVFYLSGQSTDPVNQEQSSKNDSNHLSDEDFFNNEINVPEKKSDDDKNFHLKGNSAKGAFHKALSVFLQSVEKKYLEIKSKVAYFRETRFGYVFENTAYSAALVGVGYAAKNYIPLFQKNTQDMFKKSDITFKDIGGYEEVIDWLRLSVVDVYKNMDDLLKKGYDPNLGKGILLHGPPGTGKTLIARALAGELGLECVVVNIANIVDKYQGESAKNIQRLFAAVRKRARETKKDIVVILDEVDSVALAKTSGNGNGANGVNEACNQLLRELDEENNKFLLAATTNKREALEAAFFRAGRFASDHEIGLPDDASRLKIIQMHQKKYKLGSDVDINKIVQSTVGFNCADLKDVFQKACLIRPSHPEINQQDIDLALLIKKKSCGQKPAVENNGGGAQAPLN